MFNWFWDRVLNEKRVGYLLDKAMLQLEGRSKSIAKEAVISLLEDEEIAQGVVQYGDALFSRYSGKFWSSVGGKQKGVNYAVGDMKDQMMPDILDEDGNPSISKLIGLGAMKFLSGNLGGGGGKALPQRNVKNPFDVR